MVSEERVIENIPSFYQRDTSSNNYRFIISYTSEIDKYLLEIAELKEGFQIDTAENGELDIIARNFNLRRQQSEDDDTFRQRIKSYLPSFSGEGRIGDLTNVISVITGLPEDTITIITTEDLIFVVNIAISDETNLDGINLINETIQKNKAAGTYLKGTNFVSANDTFYINLSFVNGSDLIR